MPTRMISKMRNIVLALLFLLLATVAPAQTPQSLSPTSRKDLSITVYEAGLALVRDSREVRLPVGTVRVRLTGIPSHIEPDSVQIESASAPERLAVLEQNYEYSPLSANQLLERYIGREVTIVRLRVENKSQVEEPVLATLVSDTGSPIWKIDGKLVTGVRSNHYIFSNPPPDLFPKPTLICLLNNHEAGSQTLQLTYLTTGIQWSAAYLLTLHPADEKADLLGWASIANQAGADFPHATLQLVAGTVHQVEARPRPLFSIAGSAGGMAESPNFTQQPFSAYHLYTLARRTSLLNGESKQISLVRLLSLPFTKDYEVNGRSYDYRMPQPSGAPWSDPVELHLRFRNVNPGGPAEPLPAGIVRVYQAGPENRVQLLGEDRMGNTPEGEMVNLNAGNAFDVVERRKQLSFRRLGPEVSESVYEITLRNHRPRPITVTVNEPFNGDWRILSSTLPYEKTSAFSARFRALVPSQGQTEFQYRVQVNWGGAVQ